MIPAVMAVDNQLTSLARPSSAGQPRLSPSFHWERISPHALGASFRYLATLPVANFSDLTNGSEVRL
jgi:hypothetical protein